jgi:hypothetical protein
VRSVIAVIAAEVISSLGSLMALVARPWLVLETTGSPGRMSLVLAAEAEAIATGGGTAAAASSPAPPRGRRRRP